MLFKDIKQGNQLYIFDRINTEIKVGNISSISFPHLSAQPNMGMVVDIDVLVGNDTYKYQMKDTSETAYVGTTVISPNIENILNEIRMTRQQSEEVINSVGKHEAIKEKCTKLLAEYDPQYKERQQNEQRLLNIENSISELKELVLNMNNNK